MVGQDAQRLKARAWEAIEARRQDLIALSRRIHDNPETKFEEFKAAQWLTEALERLPGVEVKRGVAKLPTAFTARLPGRAGCPTIAFIAEYDALPTVGHGCGHNLISTIAIAAAIGMHSVMPELVGTSMVIGTPAEEGGGGKVFMIEHGVFRGVDAALMTHPLDKCAVGERLLALSGLTIEFHGRAAHASGKAYHGINALYALIQTFASINQLREQFQGTDRVHGIITHGGERPNIIPEFARAEFYVRGSSRPRVDELLEKVKNCARGAAIATGCTVEFPKSEIPDLASSRVNRILNAAYARNLAAQGYAVIDRADEEPMGASNDLSNVSQLLPTAEVTVPIGPAGLEAHTHAFAAAAASDVAWDSLIRAAKAEVATAIDLATDPQLFEQVREAFRAG